MTFKWYGANFDSWLNKQSGADKGVNLNGNWFSEFGTGLKNWWYSVTGRNYLTPDAQHTEELERQKNQITAQDLEKAGISRYAMSSNGFSAPDQTGKGGKFLDAILATQQIAQQAQNLREQKYNYETSKALGIRTSDQNPLSQLSAYVKVLTGKDLADLGEGGLLQVLKDWLFPQSSGGNSVPSPVLFGAKADLGSNVGVNIANLSGSPLADVLKAGFKYDPKKTLPAGRSAEDLPKSEPFDMGNAILRVHHEGFYEEIGKIARGQAQGLSESYLDKLVNKYVGELRKEGFTEEHSIGIVQSWLTTEMLDLGYQFDFKDHMWYYTGR